MKQHALGAEAASWWAICCASCGIPHCGTTSGTLIGENPEDIDRLWHKIFMRFTGGGRYGGLVKTLLSGKDIALSDIKGKTLGKPIYRLFGGPMWDSALLCTHVGPREPDAAAKSLVAEGCTALKLDPFSPEMGQYHRNYARGSISAAGAAHGIDSVAAIREAVGPDIEFLIDYHINFDVPTAINIAIRLGQQNIGWLLEEPVQPDSNEALHYVKESVGVPLCVGERLHSRYDFVPLLLADWQNTSRQTFSGRAA